MNLNAEDVLNEPETPPTERPRPAEIQTIADLATLRLLAHPLRLQILEALRGEGGRPRTVKELAAALGAPPTRLYHHVHLLAERGVVRVAETRLVSGIPERRYAVVAFRLTVDKTLLAPDAAGEDALEVYLSVVLDEVRAEIKRAVRAGLIALETFADDRIAPGRLVLGRKWLRLRPEQVEELNLALDEVMTRYAPEAARGDLPTGDDPLYEYLIGFYPILPPDEGGQPS